MLIGSSVGAMLATFPKPIEAGVIADVIARVGIILFIIEVAVFSAEVAVEDKLVIVVTKDVPPLYFRSTQ